jgi:two-component system, OmpR family, response regulator
VFQQGNEIQLTEIEYKILLLLIQYPTKIFSLQNLYD